MGGFLLMANNEKKFIKVYERFMTDERFDSRDHIVYATIKAVMNYEFNNTAIVSTEILSKWIGFSTTSRNKVGMKESIEKLINAGYIIAYSDIGCTTILEDVSLSNTFFVKEQDIEEDGRFTKLYFEDLYKFFAMDDKYKMKIYSLYINIISRIFNSASSDKYTMPTIEELEEETGINRKTISRYISVLMENELVYCIRVRMARDRVKNVYSRWQEKETVRMVFGDREVSHPEDDK